MSTVASRQQSQFTKNMNFHVVLCQKENQLKLIRNSLAIYTVSNNLIENDKQQLKQIRPNLQSLIMPNLFKAKQKEEHELLNVS